MVASSVGREGTRIDGRRLGNGGSGESTEEMQQRDCGGHEARGTKESEAAKTRRDEKSSSRGQTVESCSSDEGLGREDESKVRRTAATKPGALLHSGLIMM